MALSSGALSQQRTPSQATTPTRKVLTAEEKERLKKEIDNILGLTHERMKTLRELKQRQLNLLKTL